MTDAPTTIDGARVLRIADVSTMPSTGLTRHVVRGEVVKGFAALAIARYDGEAGVYLFYCDADWSAITDTYHETIEQAIAQARFEFGPVSFAEPTQ
jgi:hypothetical protein